MKAFRSFILVISVLCTVLFSTSIFVIQQGERGLVFRLGQLVGEDKPSGPIMLSPGLHFKWPFIEQVRLFDTRMQTLDIQSSRIVTREKKDVIVDYYVKWKIIDLGRFFRATNGSQVRAERLLEQQMNTSLRAEFGKRLISQLVTGGRDDVMIELRDRAEVQAGLLGVQVMDVRLKGIELPPSTSQQIYQRMRANMQKIANRHRADGQAEAEAIQAQSDAKVTVVLAEAKSQAQTLRAEGQAQSAKIYAEAFGRDQGFFAFYQSLKAYTTSFNRKEDLIVVDSSSAFFDYFKAALSKK